MAARVALTAIGLAVGLGGCDGCGKDQAPYTPFGVASTPPSAPAPSASAAEEVDDAAPPKPSFAAQPAMPAPAGATSWTLDGRALAAPPGRAFERGLAADFDADQKNEIVAWTVPAGSAPGAPGELWLYPAEGAPKKLVELPGFVPTGPACKHVAALTRTGPRTVTLDVSAKCQTTLLPRAPTRALLVVAPLGSRERVLGLRLADAAPGETLRVDVDSTDRDADGRDDVKVSFTVSTGGERPASAQLIWLDRAAGASRETAEPLASLTRVATGELWRSKQKKLAPSVRAGVGNVRRLLSTLCAEGGVPRVFEHEGAALSCGALAPVVERLLGAEVGAALADGDVTLGFAAFGRDGWYFGKAGDKTRKDLEKRLLDAVKTLEPADATTVVSDLARPSGSLHFGRLAFASDQTLSILGAGGVLRASKTGALEPADDAATGWPIELTRSDGAKASTLIAACDESVISIGFVDAKGGTATAQGTELLAPRPGACKGGRAPALGLTPESWKDAALEALIAGEPVGPRLSRAEAALRPHVPGSSRSPDGKLMLVPTSLGLLLVGADKPELWRVKSGSALEECAVSDHAERVACVDHGAVKLWLRP